MTPGQRGSYRTGIARREQILDSALGCFVAVGYRATSLRDIASASGISHPALLRYFGSRADILTAVIERFDGDQRVWWERDPSTVPFVPEEAARRNAERPGWVELFTTLLCEATSPEHPGHELMYTRHRRGAEFVQRILARYTSSELSAAVETNHIAAAWDGLQIISLYSPGEVDIVGQLARYSRIVRDGGAPAAAARLPRAPELRADDVRANSRQRIVGAAMRAYAGHGYFEAPLREIAAAAQVSKAGLVNIFPTKESLLMAVLQESISLTPLVGLDLAGLGDDFTLRPRWRTAAEVVLVSEASVASHPAHAFMRARLTQALAKAESHLDEAYGRGADDESANRAQWLVSLGLGLAIHWLYEPDDVPPRFVFDSYLGSLDRAPV